MRSLTMVAAMMLGLGMGASSPAVGFDGATPAPSGDGPGTVRPASVEEPPLYRPWRPASPRALRGRTSGDVRGGDGKGMAILPLAPDHVGFTIEAQPSLYWYLSQETSAVLEFTLRDDRTVAPLVETRLPSPAQPGVHRIALKDLGLKLESGVQYRWYVTLLQGPEASSKDIVAGGMIERLEMIEALPHLEATKIEDAVYRYAGAGIWYDAIRAISEQIAASPGDATLRCKRARLLREVKLAEVAKYDCRE